MSELIRGIAAPRQLRAPETLDLEADIERLAQHIIAVYPSESTKAIQKEVETLDGDNEAIATLFGEALVQVALEACQDHRLKQQNLFHLLGDIRTEVDRNILALDWHQRPLDGNLILEDGRSVSFTSDSRSPDHDCYLLWLGQTGAVAAGRRWEEEYSIKLIDLRGAASKRLSVYTALSIGDHNRKDLIIDGQGNQRLAQFTKMRQENRPGYDPDIYHWSTYWLPEDNDLLASWAEFQSSLNVHGYILEEIAKKACVRSLESSIGDDGQLHRIQLVHNTPVADKEAEELRPDSSIKLRQLGHPHDSLKIEVWQKQQADGNADSSFGRLDLGTRTDIHLIPGAQASIHSWRIESNPPSPSLYDNIRY